MARFVQSALPKRAPPPRNDGPPVKSTEDLKRPSPAWRGTHVGAGDRLGKRLHSVKTHPLLLLACAPRSRATGASTAISSTSTATAKSARSKGIVWAKRPISGAPSKKPP